MSEETESKEVDPPYVPRTNKEINELAQAIDQGRVFTSAQVNRSEDVSMVFMALALAGPEFSKWAKENDISVVYEFLDKAGPRSINGYPCFFSFRCVSKDDWAKVLALLQKMETVRKAVMLPDEPEEATKK